MLKGRHISPVTLTLGSSLLYACEASDRMPIYRWVKGRFRIELPCLLTSRAGIGLKVLPTRLLPGCEAEVMGVGSVGNSGRRY